MFIAVNHSDLVVSFEVLVLRQVVFRWREIRRLATAYADGSFLCWSFALIQLEKVILPFLRVQLASGLVGTNSPRLFLRRRVLVI
jgi:hypothetical protein